MATGRDAYSVQRIEVAGFSIHISLTDVPYSAFSGEPRWIFTENSSRYWWLLPVALIYPKVFVLVMRPDIHFIPEGPWQAVIEHLRYKK